jgi:hypothetical protein
LKVAEIYRKRWTVETFFQVITTSLNCEIKTLGYPRAALFSFSMALLVSNALSTLRAALRSVHGTGKIEASLSNYYLAEEITMTYRANFSRDLLVERGSGESGIGNYWLPPNDRMRERSILPKDSHSLKIGLTA